MFTTRSRLPVQAAAGDGYAHLPARASRLAARLTHAPVRGLCGALLTDTVITRPICPTCAARGHVPPAQLARAAQATPIPSPQPAAAANADIRASDDPAKPCLELRCQICRTLLCDVEDDDNLAALSNVAAAHQQACHPPPAGGRQTVLSRPAPPGAARRRVDAATAPRSASHSPIRSELPVWR
jgi:hypothetical protein